MRKIFPIMLVIVIIVILGILYTGLVQEGPTYPTNENGLVENAQLYCGQYTEETCNNNAYLPEGTQEAIECYWNSEITTCQANIGYQ